MTGEQHIRVWSKETGFITLGAEDELGRGGEGTVYSLPDQADLVAKVYHTDSRTASAFRKLEVMIDYFPVTGDRETGHLYVAWPRHIIYDGPAGDAVGFLMPRVERKNSLLDYYIQSYRSTNALQSTMGICALWRQAWRRLLPSSMAAGTWWETSMSQMPASRIIST